MKNQILLSAVLIFTSIISNAGDINLPRPDMNGDAPLSQTLKNRASCRSFDTTRQLSNQQISNLLWSAVGINRPDEEKVVNPTAMNRQEIDVYLFSADGVYFYDPKANSLVKKADGDHRKLVAARQEFVLDAPISLVLVANVDKLGNGDHAKLMAACDAGIACQNINLFCTANGLATVPRATMDSEAISKLLNLPETALPILNNPVGYKK